MHWTYKIRRNFEVAGARSTAHRRIFSKGRWNSALVLLCVLFAANPGVAQTNAPTEYQLKAAFLFNFAKFVEWPPDSFAAPQSDFTICILGADPFGQAIDKTLRGRAIDGHTVAIRRLRNTADLRRCQIAFISASEQGHVQNILKTIRGANVLVVGETPGFAASGGAIQFEMQDRRIRFVINPEAAEQAGLWVSSKLLSLATIVHAAPSNGKG